LILYVCRYYLHPCIYSKWFLELTLATRIPDSESQGTALFLCSAVKIPD
jgi:hypothetical protein